MQTGTGSTLYNNRCGFVKLALVSSRSNSKPRAFPVRQDQLLMIRSTSIWHTSKYDIHSGGWVGGIIQGIRSNPEEKMIE